MSQGQRLEFGEVNRIAERLMVELSPYCQRVWVAGSLRREKSKVGDIELVIKPDICKDMMGFDVSREIPLPSRGKVIKNGSRYKQIALPDGINLDLFIVLPPAQWGVIYLIRTGPAEFSKRFVTPVRQGGFLPSHAKVENGAVWADDAIVPMSEEIQFFEFCRKRWIEPWEREV